MRSVQDRLRLGFTTAIMHTNFATEPFLMPIFQPHDILATWVYPHKSWHAPLHSPLLATAATVCTSPHMLNYKHALYPLHPPQEGRRLMS